MWKQIFFQLTKWTRWYTSLNMAGVGILSDSEAKLWATFIFTGRSPCNAVSPYQSQGPWVSLWSQTHLGLNAANLHTSQFPLHWEVHEIIHVIYLTEDLLHNKYSANSCYWLYYNLHVFGFLNCFSISHTI